MAASRDQSLSSGYSKDEKQYVEANTGQLLRNMSPQDLRLAFVKPMTMHGIKQFPSPEEMEMMRMMISKHYGHLTHGHFHLAFELNILGSHWEKVSPFGMMSAEFIAAVLTNYVKHMEKIWSVLRHKVSNEQKQIEIMPTDDAQAIVILKEMFMRDIESPSKATDIMSSHMITKLYERKVIDDAWWTDEEWEQMKDESKQAAMKEIAQIRLHNPTTYKDKIKGIRLLELKRIMYRDLRINKNEKIMQKMEEL